MKDTGQILEAFWHLADGRCAFELKNGRHLEGYILEIKDQHIVFGGGGPLAPFEDELISIEQIDLATLYFWSDSKLCYLHAKWSVERNEFDLKTLCDQKDSGWQGQPIV